ncbi:hypothetical protein JZ751_003364 [Albula glossodonta]|uniref:Uncharacterized protein n=1 Tax=Albula glossodonta TaxID=121402 RepID=A0A8T2MZ22_9TELE|nr:hypothetical protein JZ751_003364 [Albula glossodonta]
MVTAPTNPPTPARSSAVSPALNRHDLRYGQLLRTATAIERRSAQSTVSVLEDGSVSSEELRPAEKRRLGQVSPSLAELPALSLQRNTYLRSGNLREREVVSWKEKAPVTVCGIRYLPEHIRVVRQPTADPHLLRKFHQKYYSVILPLHLKGPNAWEVKQLRTQGSRNGGVPSHARAHNRVAAYAAQHSTHKKQMSPATLHNTEPHNLEPYDLILGALILRDPQSIRPDAEGMKRRSPFSQSCAVISPPPHPGRPLSAERDSAEPRGEESHPSEKPLYGTLGLGKPKHGPPPPDPPTVSLGWSCVLWVLCILGVSGGPLSNAKWDTLRVKSNLLELLQPKIKELNSEVGSSGVVLKLSPQSSLCVFKKCFTKELSHDIIYAAEDLYLNQYPQETENGTCDVSCPEINNQWNTLRYLLALALSIKDQHKQ